MCPPKKFQVPNDFVWNHFELICWGSWIPNLFWDSSEKSPGRFGGSTTKFEPPLRMLLRNKDSGPKLTNFRACEDLHGRWKLTKQPGCFQKVSTWVVRTSQPIWSICLVETSAGSQQTINFRKQNNSKAARFKFPLETSSTRDQVWPARSSCFPVTGISGECSSPIAPTCSKMLELNSRSFMPGSSWTTSPRKYKVNFQL